MNPLVSRHDVVVYHDPTKWAAVPANNGANGPVWQWGDELLVGFTMGTFARADGHQCTYDKPLIARVAYQSEKGEPQGQQQLAWMAEGLLDAVIPATHNHKPDPYNWVPESFFAAAKRSPRPCAVWPQLWPTPEPWNSGHNQRHAAEAVQQRCADLKAAGADGAYFFNFCCYGPLGGFAPSMKTSSDQKIVRNEVCS